MIVTCPQCTARYKIPESKIQGRGAKITCPNCAHKFVVYRDDEGKDDGGEPVPPDLIGRDFRKVGIHWKVRRGIGMTYDFHDLRSIRAALDDGQISTGDVITYDARTWTPLTEIPNLERFFLEVWEKAERGETTAAPEPEESDEEDDSDAPTTIMGQGTSLSKEIEDAVRSVATPAPATDRKSAPKATPAPKQQRTGPSAPGRDGRDPASAGRDPISSGRDPISGSRDPASAGRDPISGSRGAPQQRSAPPPPARSSGEPAGAPAPAAPKLAPAPAAIQPDPEPIPSGPKADPFANLSQKAQEQQKSGGGGAIKAIVLVFVLLMVLVPVVLLVGYLITQQ